MARCLAAISNRGSISSRSVLSGDRDVMTVQVRQNRAHTHTHLWGLT